MMIEERKILKETVDIVLVTHNRLPFLKMTVDAIYERTQWPFRLIIVDNNSTDGTVEWLVGDRRVYKVVSLERNEGMTKGMIEGFHYVKSDYFIFTQDDALPPKLEPCWLERLFNLMKENEKEVAGISLPIRRLVVTINR